MSVVKEGGGGGDGGRGGVGWEGGEETVSIHQKLGHNVPINCISLILLGWVGWGRKDSTPIRIEER